MKLFQLKKSQIVPLPIHKAWEFFSSPHNLSKITPPYLNFKISAAVSGNIYEGMIIQYRVNPLPLASMHWVTEITHMAAPHMFIDEQRLGPYAFWQHQHHFREVEGGTEVSDLVYYRLPLGILGRFAHWLFVKPQLIAIFEYRRRVLTEMFGPPLKKPEIHTV